MRKHIIDKDGKLLIRRIGREWRPMGDTYHFLISSSWSVLIIAITFGYFVLNCLFAVMFIFGGDCISGAKTGSFEDLFFFSVQTMSTIGYGGMTPKTFYAHVVVTIVSLAGLLFLAIATGLIFAKFSRPTARIIFSQNAVIRNFNDKPHLMFRLANIRANYIMDTKIRLMSLYTETTPEGDDIRRFKDLPLVRSELPIFSLTWLVFHKIDENSPLYNICNKKLDPVETSFVVLFQGIDTEHTQTMYARHIYHLEDILIDHKFVDVFMDDDNGERILNYKNFHKVEQA